MSTLNHSLNQYQRPPILVTKLAQPHLISNRGTFTHKSNSIRKRQAQNILNAFDYAEWLGVPLNVYLVILLNDTIQQASSTAFKKILHKYSAWLAYKRKKGVIQCPPIYTFSHENPRNNPHVNWCLHIPDAIIDEFNVKLPRWIASVQGQLVGDGISNESGDTLNNQKLKSDGYNTVAKYIIKGIDPDFINHFGLRALHDRKGPQGIIYGQRAGFSRSLGPTAMKRGHFKPMAFYFAKRRKALGMGHAKYEKRRWPDC